jgi:hypothetical protein
MKRLLLAALLTLSLSVNAAVVAETVNAGGGTIALTDNKCTRIQNAFVAYTYVSSGQSLLGCWTTESSRVFIQWNDGDLRSYPLDMFRQPAGNKKNYL